MYATLSCVLSVTLYSLEAVSEKSCMHSSHIGSVGSSEEVARHRIMDESNEKFTKPKIENHALQSICTYVHQWITVTLVVSFRKLI